SRRAGGDPLVCARWARVWPAAPGAPDWRVAALSREVARNHWDDSEVEKEDGFRTCYSPSRRLHLEHGFVTPEASWRVAGGASHRNLAENSCAPAGAPHQGASCVIRHRVAAVRS